MLKNRKLREIPSFLVFEFQLHKLMYVLAGVGHVPLVLPPGLAGRAVRRAARAPVRVPRRASLIWPSTFFLFILSAAAVGPSFILLTTWLVAKISGKRLVGPKYCTCWAASPACCCRSTCWRRPSTR